MLQLIEVARYMGVPPDWFDDKPLFWMRWGAVALDIHNTLSTPPDAKAG